MSAKAIDNIHDIIVALNKQQEIIILSSDMYDFLFKSNWDCTLSNNLKEYAKTHKVLRGDENDS